MINMYKEYSWHDFVQILYIGGIIMFLIKNPPRFMLADCENVPLEVHASMMSKWPLGDGPNDVVNKITDTITFTNEMHVQLEKLMENPAVIRHKVDTSDLSEDVLKSYSDAEAIEEKYAIPADIVLSDTIPITDIEIDDHVNNANVLVHIHIFRKNTQAYLNMLATGDIPENVVTNFGDPKNADMSTVGVIVGIIKLIEDRHTFTASIVASPLTKYLTVSFEPMKATGAYKEYFDMCNLYGGFPQEDIKYISMLYYRLFTALSHWYEIQIALLNPLTKVVFNSCKVPDNNSRSKTKSGKKRPLKYIRRISVDFRKLNDILTPTGDRGIVVENGDSSFVRKTMLWHVAGFWRKTKSGKLSFVQGHWRGPLRDMAQETTASPRERELVINNKMEGMI